MMQPFYQDTSATIYHGESLALLRERLDDEVDAVITDPPYSSGGQFRSDRMQETQAKYVQTGTFRQRADFSGDNRDQRAYGYWSALWLSEALRITKPGGLILLFTDWRQLPVTSDALQAGGWLWRGIMPWNKTEAARPERGRPRNQCEYILWGSKGPLDESRKELGCFPGFFTVVVRQADKHHIAGKPTALMQQLIELVVPGGLVLDPFMGSGTTLVAAKATGRRAIGCDLERHNCEIAQQRLQQETLPLFAQQEAA